MNTNLVHFISAVLQMDFNLYAIYIFVNLPIIHMSNTKFKLYAIYVYVNLCIVHIFFRTSDFTIGWKMQEIGQLVVVDFGEPLSLYGLVRMRMKLLS